MRKALWLIEGILSLLLILPLAIAASPLLIGFAIIKLWIDHLKDNWGCEVRMGWLRKVRRGKECCNDLVCRCERT